MKAALANAVLWLGSFGDERAAKEAPKAKAASPPERSRVHAVADEVPALLTRDAPGAWTPGRMRVAAALWGDGFVGPGGEEEVLRLAKPLGLQSSHSLLNVGAGLGGAARCISTASGAWVSAYEQNPDLAAAGEALSKKAKLEKKAEIKPLDPAAPKFRANYYHHALVQEVLWTVADKNALLASLSAAVKPGGQVVITDITEGDTPLPPEDASLKAWARLDRAPPHLVSAKAETALLSRHGLDIRITEDISARHVAQAVASWRALIGVIAGDKPTPAQAMTVVQEAELWLRRLALIRSGRLKLMRWHAIRR